MNWEQLGNGWEFLFELCIKDGSLIYINISRKFWHALPWFHAAPDLLSKPPPGRESLMENILIAASQ